MSCVMHVKNIECCSGADVVMCSTVCIFIAGATRLIASFIILRPFEYFAYLNYELRPFELRTAVHEFTQQPFL
jgi:hypothetical protein